VKVTSTANGVLTRLPLPAQPGMGKHMTALWLVSIVLASAVIMLGFLVFEVSGMLKEMQTEREKWEVRDEIQKQQMKREVDLWLKQRENLDLADKLTNKLRGDR
jgi:hypothetical protein